MSNRAFHIRLPSPTSAKRSTTRWKRAAHGRAERLGDFGTVAERAAVRRSDARSGDGTGEGALEAIEGQVLEVEYEGAFRRILRVGEDALGGPDAEGLYALPSDDTTKRRGGSAPTAVRVLEWEPSADILKDIAAAPASKAGIAAIRALEQRWVRPGAYHATDPAHPLPLSPEDARRLTGGSAPTLLLLHGTFSNPSAAFRDLAGTAEWDRIRAKYGERIVAYGHRTLSESPVQNATDLLGHLARGCELHLLTHSRGGLIGELLLQSEWNHPAPDDLRELGSDFLALTKKLGAKSDEHDTDEVEALRGELRRFREAHAEIAPRIARFVRVACPAAGTALAGPRLHKFLSAVLSGIGVVSGWGGNPLYGFIRAVCLDIVSRGTTEGDLPGLAAMSPGRPFVKLLASAGAIDSPLTIVAGDVEGRGLLGKAAVFAADLFFRTDHDLVVNTPSMYAGAARVQKPEEVFYRGPSVTHFSYFESAPSRGSICEALVRAEPVTPRSLAPRGKSRAPEGAATVFMLPGVGGSRLGIESREIWVNYFRLIFGGIAKLADRGAPRSGVDVLGWDDAYYADLHAALSQHFHVKEHPYDWRLSIARLGAELGARLSDALEGGATVHVLAHSMGGLVARAALVDAGIRARFVAAGGRVLMLGTPNRGSVSALQMLNGDDALAQRIARWDVTHDPKEIEAFLCAFPGLLGLVPLEILEEQPALLRDLPAAREAIQAWRAISTKSELEAIEPIVRYVAGVAEHTPKSARCDASGEWTYEWSRRGDGRVLHATGLLDAAHTWYVDAVHGDLPRVEHAYPAYLELLRDGWTDRLPQTPPGIRGGGDDAAPPAPDMARSESLVDAMLGGAAASKRGSAGAPPLRITVRHGDLAKSELPFLVGHYRGDALTSSDRAVDERLGGALRRRLERGLLPSEPGTAEVIYGDSGSPAAVVVGLGAAGSLDRRALVQCFRTGLLAYATAAAERKTARKLSMSTVAIGASDLSLLSAAAVVQSFAEAAVRTNRALRASRAEVFQSLELVELYADRAIELGHAVRELERTLPVALQEGETIAPASVVRRGIGYRGARPHSERGGSWASFAVERADEGKLRFQIATDGPRTDITEVEIAADDVRALWAAIDEHPRDATALASRFAAAEVPRSFRTAIGRGRDVLLTVDAASAQVPWELVAFTDRGWGGRPEAVVRHGLVRRIASGEGQARDPIASNRSVLVIGDPEGSELPGARAEAQRVLALFLDAEWDASAAIAESGAYTKGALTAEHGGYRALHIAAHGGFDGDESFVDLGDELKLRSQSLLAWDALPELVFLNCCYTGAIKIEALEPREQTRHSAQLAAAFLERGVRAFVAAGWAVDDGAARLFAERFYAAMLSGEAFGRAVDHARRATQLRYPEDSTWAAYQCYGDPEYRLLRTHDEAAIAPFVAQTEAEEEVGTLMGLLRSRPASAHGELTRRLERLTASIERHGWRDGELLRKLAGAYRELGDLDGALRCFDRALDALDGHAAIKILIERAETDSRAGYASGDDGAHHRAIEVARGFEAVLAGLGRENGELDPMRARVGRLIAGAQLRLAVRRESGWEACLESAWTHFASLGGGAPTHEADRDAWAASAAAVLSAPAKDEAASGAPLPLDVLEWRVDRAWVAWLLEGPPPEPLEALLRLAGNIRGPGSRSAIARAEIVALALAALGHEEWTRAVEAYEAALARRAGRYRDDLTIERLECFLTLAQRRRAGIDPAGLLSKIIPDR